MLLSFVLGGGPREVVSTAAFHARVRGSVPGFGGLKKKKCFFPILAQFSLYVHKGGLKPDSFHFMSLSFVFAWQHMTLEWCVNTAIFTFLTALTK